MAIDNNTQMYHIGEAKTCDNLKTQHTKYQLLEFSNRIIISGKSNGKYVPLYIMILEGCKSHLHQVLDELDLLNKENIHMI